MNARRNLLATLGALLIVAATTAFVTYRLSGNPSVKAAVENRDALEWLRADFSLSDAQFARIKELHEAYSVVCAEHCLAIQRAARARDQLAKSTEVDSAALAAADQRLQELRQICESAIAAHVRECASHMSPAAAERYLALVLPKIADFDHRAPPDIQLNAHPHH